MTEINQLRKTNQQKQAIGVEEILNQMVKNWPSEFVARKRIGDFTGGMVSPKAMANYDSLGTGPEESLKIGRNRGYTVRSLISWLKNRTVTT